MCIQIYIHIYSKYLTNVIIVNSRIVKHSAKNIYDRKINPKNVSNSDRLCFFFQSNSFF